MNERNMSDSRTYLVLFYDVTTPDQIHFKKVTLPSTIVNTSSQAKLHFLLTTPEKTIRTLACTAFEDFEREILSIFEGGDPKQEAAEALKLLAAWDADQKVPLKNYTLIVANLLGRLGFQESFLNADKQALEGLRDSIKPYQEEICP